MEIFVGVLVCLFIEVLLWVAWRMWRKTLPPLPTQPPSTPAQMANQQAYEAQEAATPRAVRLKVRRRAERGRRRGYVEREYKSFE